MALADWVLPTEDRMHEHVSWREAMDAIDDIARCAVDPANGLEAFAHMLGRFVALKSPIEASLSPPLVGRGLPELSLRMAAALNQKGFHSFLHRIFMDRKLFDRAASLLEHFRASGLPRFYEFHVMKAVGQKIRFQLSAQNRPLETYLSWCGSKVEPLLASCFGECPAQLERTRALASILVVKTFIRQRSGSLYSLISGEDQEDLEELAQALLHPLSHDEVGKFVWPLLRRELDLRLLHVGISTRSILGHLKTGIRALQRLDPSCWLLEQYLKTVRGYLVAKRKKEYGDEVIRLISWLAEDPVEQPFKEVMERCKFDVPDLDPRNFDSCILADIRSSTKSGNLFTILANFFDSSESFVSTFKCYMIRQRIWHSASPDQLTQLVRDYARCFEGSEWKECLVIIKDFYLSDRLNCTTKEPVFSMVTASHLFWPELERTPFFLPSPELQRARATHEDTFKAGQPGRRLEWTNAIGRVELEVQFDDGLCRPFECSNDEASILLLLAESEGSFSDLQGMTEFSDDRLRACLTFWFAEGVLEKRAGRFALKTHLCQSVGRCIDLQMAMWEEFGPGDQATSPEGQAVFEKVFPLVLGLLRNAGAQPLGKIQRSLGLFSADYKEKEEGLSVFLDSKVAELVLQVSPDGLYSLRK